MKSRAVIHVEEPVRRGPNLHWQGVLEVPGEAPRTMWFAVPEHFAPGLTPNADPFAIHGALFGMCHGVDVRIQGKVSPSLLWNLEELTRVWQSWFPKQFSVLQIDADHEREFTPRSQGAICLFTGGVDSTFTALRHTRTDMRRRKVDLRAGLLIGGAFDLDHSATDQIEAARQRAQKILNLLGIPLWSVTNNFRDLELPWGLTHGAALVGVLSVFGGEFATGLIGSSRPYGMAERWGTNHFTDPMCSSAGFQVRHDGAECTRAEKVAAIARFPEMLQELRVCFVNTDRSTNCGSCEKCTHTRLELMAAGVGDVLPGPKPPITQRGLRLSRYGTTDS